MFKDRVVVWVVEYIFGGILVASPLAGFCGIDDIDAYTWSAGLFIVCLGVILISCASSMRQRLSLARRIDVLVGRITACCASSRQSIESKKLDL